MLLTEVQAKYVEKFIELKSNQKVAAFYRVNSKTVSEHIRDACERCKDTARRVEEVKKQAIKPLQKTGDVPTAAQLLQLVESQRYCCALTGESIKESANASLDHIKPVSMGGANETSNLQWVLREINDMKGVLTQERFIELCCKVADKHRSSLTGGLEGSSGDQ